MTGGLRAKRNDSRVERRTESCLLLANKMPRIYRNKDKEKSQLGIAFTTASQKLQRLLLFELVKECKKDCCFRCGEKIERIEDFSIEHKVAWLDKSPDLFWDLNNIAYSHISCNRKAGRKPTGWSVEAKAAMKNESKKVS